MIDGWMGDDWFHYGAFRLANIAWIGSQTGYKGEGKAPSSGGYDDYENFRYGSANDWAKKSGYDQLPFWQRIVQHPAMTSIGRARRSISCWRPIPPMCRRSGNRGCGIRRTCTARSRPGKR